MQRQRLDLSISCAKPATIDSNRITNNNSSNNSNNHHHHNNLDIQSHSNHKKGTFQLVHKDSCTRNCNCSQLCHN